MLIRNIKHDDYNKYILLINSYLSQEKYNNFLKNTLNDNHQINPRDYCNNLRSLLYKNVICKEAEIIFL